MYTLNNNELNFLLFGSSSIFHNAGLSIYSLSGEYFQRHNLSFKLENFEKIKLPSLEEKLSEASDNLNEILSMLIKDATETANKLSISVGRQGVLFSHINLIDQMRPHIHRQGYSTEILPCITVHYRIGNKSKSVFNYWDIVTQENAINNDLCKRDNILEWCKHRPCASFDLPKEKNIILFNSGLLPHSITHTEDLNIYFIFDHVVLKDKTIYRSDLPIILHE